MSMMDLVGHTLGQYHIDAPLDAGGMGKVFRGTHIYLKRPAAIKVMNAHLALNARFRERFLQEAQSAAALKHPNIVSIYEFGEQDGQFYLVMELVPDGSVRSLLRLRSRGQSWPLSLGLDLVRQAAEGLAAAHAQKVIHRDIKPDNLLLSRLDANEERYQLKISDFGLARLAEGSGLTSMGIPMGTLAYMSPEQCQGDLMLDGRSDIYSLGIVLYEVVTGYPPFQIENFQDAFNKHTNREPPRPRSVYPDLPQMVEDIILTCIAKKPDARFQSGTALARSLQMALELPEVTVMMTTLLLKPPKGPDEPTSMVIVEAPQATAPRPISRVEVTPPPPVSTLPGRGTSPRVRVLDKTGQTLQVMEILLQGITVGRQRGNAIVLPVEEVSREHVQIFWEGRTIQVKDLGSQNGTLLGSARLSPHVSQPWSPGQVLRVGPYWLSLEGGASTLVPGSQGGLTTTAVFRDTMASPTAVTTSVGGSERIGMLVEPRAFSLTPGQPARLQVTLANLGTTVDWFKLEVDGIDRAWMQGLDQEVQLNPGMQEVVDLTVTAPRVPASLAQSYAVTIQARSRSKPDEVGSLRMHWTVLPFAEAELRVEPRRVRGRGKASYTVTMRNGGNTAVRYALEGEDDEQNLAYRFGRGEVQLAPGNVERVGLLLQGRRHWVGREERQLFHVHAQSAEHHARLSGTAEFINRALIPGWVVPVVVALLVVGSLGLSAVQGWFPFAHPGLTPTPSVAILQSPPPVTVPPLGPTPATPTAVPVTPTAAPTATPTSMPTATPTTAPPAFTVVVRQASIANNGGHGADESVSCNSGEQMLSGGYSTQGTPSSNFPSGSNTWEVTTDYSGGQAITAYVLCLQAGFNAQLLTVQQNATTTANVPLTVTATCPAGTVLIGGGFLTPYNGSHAAVSAPTNDLKGWTVSIGPDSNSNVPVTAYALCAGAYLTNVAAIPRPFAISSDPANINGVSVGCSGNQFLTGGGFLSQDPTDTSVSIFILGAVDNGSWTVKGARPSGSFQVTAYALCVTPPQHL